MHYPAMPIGGYNAKSFLHRVPPPSMGPTDGCEQLAAPVGIIGEITSKTPALSTALLRQRSTES
jgi:hypothetical protein